MKRGAKEEGLLTPARISGVCTKIIFAWLYCFSVSRLVLQFQNLPSDHLQQGLAMLALLLLLAGLTWQRYSLIASGSITILFAAAGFIWRKEWLEQAVIMLPRFSGWLQWALSRLTGQAAVDASRNQDLLAMTVCLFLAFFSYLVLARFNETVLAFCLLLLAGGLNYSLPRQQLYPWLGAAGLAVAASLARNQNRTYQHLGASRFPAQARFMLQSLPVSVLGLGLAFWLSTGLTAGSFYSDGLVNWFDDLAGVIMAGETGSNQFTEFSIGESGYYPLIDRLGGPVVLSDEPVLKVEGYPQPMMLRGAVRTNYDGQSWSRALSSQLYGFGNSFWKTEQEQAFDLQRPSVGGLPVDPASLTADVHYKIAPAGQVMQTVFIAGRPLNVTPAGDFSLELFFDSAGQLFSRIGLQREQGLDIDTRLVLTGHPDFSRSIKNIRNNLSQFEQEYYEQICSRYLQLPDLPEYTEQGYLAKLEAEIAGGENDPYARARLISTYLQQYCQYNLQVAVPPADTEFVSWFLQTREGYCVYFATAMTMLCRLSGIPARYVEGYYAPGADDEDTVRTVTGQYAHAWTEIFLAGVGWVPIDATPGGPSVNPNVTPVPTSALTPVPSISPDAPSPAVSGQPSAEPTKSPFGPGYWNYILPSPWWLLLLLLVPIAYLGGSIWWYEQRHHAGWMRQHFADDRKLSIFYWQELRDIFAGLGLKPKDSETPSELIWRIRWQSIWLAGRRHCLDTVLSSVEKSLYSQYMPSGDEIAMMALIFDFMERTLQRNSNWLLFLYRRICYHRLKKEG